MSNTESAREYLTDKAVKWLKYLGHPEATKASLSSTAYQHELQSFYKLHLGRTQEMDLVVKAFLVELGRPEGGPH